MRTHSSKLFNFSPFRIITGKNVSNWIISTYFQAIFGFHKNKSYDFRIAAAIRRLWIYWKKLFGTLLTPTLKCFLGCFQAQLAPSHVKVVKSIEHWPECSNIQFDIMPWRRRWVKYVLMMYLSTFFSTYFSTCLSTYFSAFVYTWARNRAHKYALKLEHVLMTYLRTYNTEMALKCHLLISTCKYMYSVITKYKIWVRTSSSTLKATKTHTFPRSILALFCTLSK